MVQILLRGKNVTLFEILAETFELGQMILDSYENKSFDYYPMKLIVFYNQLPCYFQKTMYTIKVVRIVQCNSYHYKNTKIKFNSLPLFLYHIPYGDETVL